MRHREPLSSEFDTYEEYQEALDAYNDAEDWAFDRARDDND